MSNKNCFKKIKYYLKRYGFFATMRKIFKRIFQIKENKTIDENIYKAWIEKNELSQEEINFQKNYKFEYNPKISLVVPMYNTPEEYFKQLIQSVNNQTYSNWELILSDGSENQNDNLKKYYEQNEKILYGFLNANNGIAENTNDAIKLVSGEYIGFLDHDDLLSKDALFEVVKAINENENTEFIYSDEDKIDENGERFDPFFKPDFSKQTLECHNYITHFAVVKKTLIDKIGNLNSEFNGAQDFDFNLRVSENTDKIVHISKILYHWRVHKDSTARVAEAKPYAYEAGLEVIKKHLERTNKSGTVENGQDVPGIYKIKYDVLGNPKVSILIPNKDNFKLLKKCINSILEHTNYENYEIVIIDDNSSDEETIRYYHKITENPKVKLLKYNKKIKSNYSSLINLGVKNVDGDFIFQLSNDKKIISSDWIQILIGYAQNKEIGAVGVRTYYKNKKLESAGKVINYENGVKNILENISYEDNGYFGAKALVRNVSAVSGKALFARREVYKQVNYLDDKIDTFSDVDFCLKLSKEGYKIIYNPYVELISSNLQEENENIEEEKSFKEKWKDVLEKNDPYYNKNFKTDTGKFDLDIGVEMEKEKTQKNNKNITLRVFESFENFGLWILEKLHLNFLAKFYKDHIEGMRYLICGGLSTVVNIVAYAIAAKILFVSIPEDAIIKLFTISLSIRVTVSDTFAFILALIFAYWVNKTIVFDSKCKNIKELVKEITSFTSCRIFTQIISLALMNFAVVINMNDVLMKIIANIVVIILNFILSKLIIFKK